jgi:hypothetical protein
VTDGLLGEQPAVVTVGADVLADALVGADAAVERVAWSPPEADVHGPLTALAPVQDRIDTANREALERMVRAEATWRGVESAADTIPGFDGETVLHAGPPVAWSEMSGPQRGAVVGAALYEGWAETATQARELAQRGEIAFDPCHEHGAVGPMAGIVSPSMPVAVVDDPVHGNTAYVTFNEGLGEVLRFGAYSDEVLDHLSWVEETLAPVLATTVERAGGVDLSRLSARALQMGDEIHNRNVAATSLLVRELAPTVATLDTGATEDVLSFLGTNDHFFLNLSMAACKLAADAAADVPWSTVVTAMTRNGTEFGLRVSGLGDRWFTAEAPVVDGLFFPEYDADDANPDIGDSSIAETTGVGGFAMAAAPGITQFVGGTPAEARAFTREMYEITVGENSRYTIPALGFRGTPTGIDIARVLATGTQPIINTGIAHEEPGVGQIGAGITRAPRECFVAALVAFRETYLPAEDAPTEVPER